MESKERIYYGQGWYNPQDKTNINSTIKLSLKMEEINKLPANKFGEVEIYLMAKKTASPKSGSNIFIETKIPVE